MLKVGEKCPAGSMVKSILGQSARVAVYTTEDGQLRWNYTDNDGNVPGALAASLLKFDTLMSEIKIFAPEKHRTECYTLLGKALFSALNSEPSDASLNSFDQVSAHLYRLAQQTTRTNFVLQCMTITFIYSAPILIALHWTTTAHKTYIYCAVFGAVGACISVMQRASDIDIDWTLNGKSLLVQSGVRITLGLVFGSIFVLACKADFLLGAFKHNEEALLFLSIVAGFSERMIPELFSRLDAPEPDYV
jgi:hypothetical protein